MRRNNAAIGDAMGKLRRNYLQILRRRIFELRTFADHCVENRLEAAEIENVHMRVHSLAGSGATYGYAGVSEAARPLDRALDGPAALDPKMLVNLADNLIGACDRALMTSEPVSREKSPIIFKSMPREFLSPMPVLLTVDDDPAIHDLVQAMFGNNAHIVTAYTADEALDAIHRHCPDLILMDNYMPSTDGLKLLESLGNDKNLVPMPVIMLTANDRPHEIMRAAAAGIADYIVKPFDPRILGEKIFNLLKRSRTTVLIASDNLALRDLIAGKLRRQGFSVMEAADGGQTLALAFEHIPELIMLNQSVSEKNGRAVLRCLREDKRTHAVPILYLTANGAGQNLLESLDADAADQAVMPFIPEKVAAHVLEALGLETEWA